MSSQIIKTKIPNEIFYDFLEQICTKQKKFYIVDDISFKKAMYNNLLNNFYEDIKPFYFNSKKYYLERDKTYNYFTTIIRQICKKNTILFTSNIKYCNSNYNIRYFIYFD